MISLRHAGLDERRTVFEWLYHSSTTPFHSGPPNYPGPLPDWQQFLRDFEEFYFLESGRSRGSVMMIEDDGEAIGCLCYACFHLVPGSAELDIWFKDVAFCGQGRGSNALMLAQSYLRRTLDIQRFLIRPAERNARAVAAYKKAGFVPAADKAAAVKRFHRPEYLELYGAGDCGFEETAVLTIE